MKSKEYRLGNYVKGPLGEIMIIDVLGDLDYPDYIHASNDKAFGQNEFFSIPLTPEILEKAGGKDRGGWVGYFFETEIYGEDVRIVWQLMDGRLTIFANDNLIKYEESPTVHSFQNSVYYLTGEELPLTL